MRRFNLVASVVSLIVVVAPYAGNEISASDTSETSATSEADATTAAPETTAGTTGTSEPSDPEHRECLYRNDLLFVRNAPEPPPDIPGILGRLEAEGLAELLELPDDDLQRLSDLLSEAQLVPYAVTGGADPLELAVDLEENEEVDASPVLLTTITGHYTFAPGALPDDHRSAPANAVELEPVPPPSAIAAVVDTGYSESGDGPSWLYDRVDPVDAARDAESSTVPEEIRGHGKFVASVIAQEAPEVAVVVAAMSNLDETTFYGDLGEAAATGFTSDEIQMYLAISRLVRVSDDFAVLNLSVGSYMCPGLDQIGPPDLGSGFAIQAGVELWNGTLGTPIVAAAGNHGPAAPPHDIPFIPAAYAPSWDVLAVASVDPAGALSSFSNVMSPAGVAAIGENLLGVRNDFRDGEDEWTAWSGSSFATAVVSAYVAADGTVPSAGTIVPLTRVEQA